MRNHTGVFLTVRDKKVQKGDQRSGLAAALKLVVQPGAGVIPMSIGRGGRDATGLTGLVNSQAGKVTQFDESGGRRIVSSQLRKRFIDCEKLVGRSRGCKINGIDVEPLEPPAALVRAFLTCPIDQYASHGFGSGGEEVAATIPWLLNVGADKP